MNITNISGYLEGDQRVVKQEPNSKGDNAQYQPSYQDQQQQIIEQGQLQFNQVQSEQNDQNNLTKLEQVKNKLKLTIISFSENNDRLQDILGGIEEIEKPVPSSITLNQDQNVIQNKKSQKEMKEQNKKKNIQKDIGEDINKDKVNGKNKENEKNLGKDKVNNRDKNPNTPQTIRIITNQIKFLEQINQLEEGPDRIIVFSTQKKLYVYQMEKSKFVEKFSCDFNDEISNFKTEEDVAYVLSKDRQFYIINFKKNVLIYTQQIKEVINFFELTFQIEQPDKLNINQNNNALQKLKVTKSKEEINISIKPLDQQQNEQKKAEKQAEQEIKNHEINQGQIIVSQNMIEILENDNVCSFKGKISQYDITKEGEGICLACFNKDKAVLHLILLKNREYLYEKRKNLLFVQFFVKDKKLYYYSQDSKFSIGYYSVKWKEGKPKKEIERQ